MTAGAETIELSTTNRPVSENPFLSAALRRIRAARPPLKADDPWFAIPEKAAGGQMLRVWFATKGCTWDRSGTCTMCNYGHSTSRTPAEMVASVRDAIASAEKPITTLFVGPSGSLFDRQEVPREVRTQIYRLASTSGAREFITESRPELVTESVTEELVTSLPNLRIAVGLGLESATPWVQRFCVNKGAHNAQYERAARILRSRGVATHMNICLGTAFLSTREAIDDAEASVRWALRHGADLAVLFPLHVRPYTLLAEMTHLKLYEPPSLWSAVEVLKRLGPELCRKVQISWYRNYYESDENILALPTTCPRCQLEALRHFDQYRDEWTFDAISRLDELTCGCKQTWWADVCDGQREPLPGRLLAAYEAIAVSLDLEAEWASMSEAISEAMRRPVPNGS